MLDGRVRAHDALFLWESDVNLLHSSPHVNGVQTMMNVLFGERDYITMISLGI